MHLARRAALLLVAFLLIGLAGLAVLWYQEAGQLKSGLTAWVEARRAEGYKVTYQGPSLSGFPFTVKARLEHPEIADADGRWRWTGEAVEAEAQSWNLLTIVVHPVGRQEIAYLEKDDRIATVAATAATTRGVLSLAAGGQPESLHVTAEKLVLDAEGRGRLEAGHATADLVVPTQADLARPPGGPALPPSLLVAFKLEEVTLPDAAAAGPLGRTIATIAGRGEVDGTLAAGKPVDTLAAWRDRGGTLELKSLELDWGPLRLSGDATLALNSSLQPEGAGTAEIRGYAETINSLVARDAMKPTDGALAKAALSLLAKAPPGGGEKLLKVALRLQKQMLYAGPVRILRVPPIRWPD